ncbi:MAG TPA: Crp/Fnr family transcriptional regulator, partial [Chloroflexaceae bacterium]|nr:Crp/Fnr family transcriptional regulator [Chloroflexaceae bacterium]
MITEPSVFERVRFCSGLSPGIIRALEAIAVPLHRSSGASLQLEGEPANAMYVVVEGRVKITRLASNGREQMLTVIEPGGHFNTVAILDDGPCPANADALTEVTLLMLPRAPLLAVLDAHPPLMRALLREFSTRLRHLVNLVDLLALHSVQGRVAGVLLEQAEAAARGEAMKPLTQAEMAVRAGTVREMVGRALKNFEAQGLIR